MLEVALHSQLGELDLRCRFQSPNNGITVVFGRSGSGKTSLINMVAGLLKPDLGRITLDNETLTDTAQKIHIPPEKREIGYVFQEARLFPHYTVKGNLCYSAKASCSTSEFQKIISMLDIAPLLNRYPPSLSGGERQRVAIGRALLSKPRLLLMDEPLASLDLPRKKELLPYLAQLSKQVEIPILYVTHSLEEIVQLADYMLLLDEGKIIESGSVEKVWSSDAMKPWLEGDARSSLLTATLDHHHTSYPMSCVSLSNDIKLWIRQLSLAPEQTVRIRIHANDVSIIREKPNGSSIRNILPAQIKQIHVGGDHQAEVELQIGKFSVWSHITKWAVDELRLKTGEHVYAQIKGISVTQDDWSSVSADAN
ncbi:molybdenum ABC transporter ATP-binding protein ModC [uncultured Neptuniibacter sp.]|uniref:molybdenum ABC transporter ATP-binding protein ModC n=1 Tax=uncultured Neptuniibacter sp. TaxID=502143 RepID=UPI002626E628|nr:molybdenum ABC transporter ATP-binding protein ModC [uncultured Neptuniibacter sp.]